MAAAGRVLVRCHEILRKKARPGVTTAELDEAAERYIRSQGATPAFKGYRGFPGSICSSPNSMVVHGIPGSYRLERGDMHEDPQVPNFGEPGKGPLLEEGVVLAVEPMVTAGRHLVRMGDDGWAIF